MIPKVEDILKALDAHWELRPEKIEPVPTTIRLFRIKVDSKGFMVRVNFDRGKLSADEVVEFVDYLGKAGCPVPRIIPTADGNLCAVVQDATISVESELPGVECSSTRLDTLYAVGEGLAKIHLASEQFPRSPAQLSPLFDYVCPKLDRAGSRKLTEDEKEAISKLHRRLTEEYIDCLKIPVCWITTHGDVRGRNILVDGDTVGFTDIYSSFAPALADLVMVKDKWLTGDPAGNGRPLELEEVKPLLESYASLRPLSQEDRKTFGMIWAAWSADQFTYFAEDINRVGDPRRDAWDFHGQILRLPDLIERAEQLLE